MGFMFFGCSSLTSIDVSGFDTSNVSIMSMMFGACSSISSIDVSCYDTSNIKNMDDMFNGCINLVGGNGTKFDESKIDVAYAHIDGPDNPGYFTEKKKNSKTDPIQNVKKLVDPTGDGIIDALDASNILSQYTKYSTGAAEPTADDHAVCDVNTDGYIDYVDASKVLAYYANVSTGGALNFDEFLKQYAV